MSRSRRLTVVLLFNLVLVTGLVVVGVAAHSLAVLAAGTDCLADAAAVAVSLLAIWLASGPPGAVGRGGYPNATNIAALVNAGWLLAVNVVIAGAAALRLADGAHRVDALQVLVVSGIAAVVLLAGALILGGDSASVGDGEDLNMKAVLLDTAGDAAAAGGVAVSGAITLIAGRWYWLDPAVALAISLIVAYHAVNLIRRIAAAIRAA